jgi:hypothetical protein
MDSVCLAVDKKSETLSETHQNSPSLLGNYIIEKNCKTKLSF